MSNVSPRYDDEIDLLDLIITVWDGKWKILSISAFSLLLIFGINFTKPKPNFTATTDIQSISSFDIEKYRQFNSYIKLIEKNQNIKLIGKNKKINDEFQNEIELKYNLKSDFFQITQNYLLDLYVEHLEKSSLLEIAVDKFNLLNKENFDSETDYNEAIQKFASDIKVLRPTQESFHYLLKVNHNDKDKLKNLLAFINDEINRKVKENIISRFEIMISLQKMKIDFAINDIDLKIEKAKKDYDRNMKDRLAFLAEQAAIARKLNIKQNTTASLTFGSQIMPMTNFKTDFPFYLRGYLPIEEEIKQIKSRKDKSSFIKNLFKLEQNKEEIISDQTTKRLISLFNNTPLHQPGFKASILKIAQTNYETNNNSFLHYILAIFLGAGIGVVYIFIAKAIQNRKSTTVNS